MMNRARAVRPAIALVAALTVFAASADAVQAQGLRTEGNGKDTCVISRAGLDFMLGGPGCNGCQATQDMFVTPGSLCTIATSFQHGVSSLKITRRPAKGVAVVSNNSYGFRANPDFRGTDVFAVEVKYRDSVGNIETANVTVTVRSSP